MAKRKRNTKSKIEKSRLLDDITTAKPGEFCYFIDRWKKIGWGEIQRTIKSAYANTTNFGTKYYEDNEKITEVKNKIRQGVPKNEIRCQLENADIDFPILRPTVKQTINPGPAVAATPSISFSESLLSFRALSIINSIFSR